MVEKTTQAEVDKVAKPLIESAAEKIGLRFLGKALGLFIGELLTAEPLNTNEQIMLDKTKGLPPDAVKLKKDQGYRDKGGNIWKKDKLHKDHWDVSDRKGRKIKEVRFDGTQLWPDGPKNK